MKNIIMVCKRLYILLRKERFDVIHTHLFLSSFLGLVVALFARVPFKIMTRHYSDYMYLFGSKLRVEIDKLSLRLAHKVIAISNSVMKVVVEQDNVDPAKVIIVYNGIDMDKLNITKFNPEETKKQLGLTHCCIVGSIGSLQSRKGHRFLIDAVPLVAKQIPNIKFVIVGDGPLLSTLKTQVEKMGMSSYVHFCGYREDAYTILSTFDVFAHPSVEEGFGIVVLEALAMGKPVVASAVGGIQEIMKDSTYSRLVPPSDSSKLAEAIIAVVQGNLKSEKSKNEGKRIVRERFQVKMMVQKYEQLYKELVFTREHNVTQVT